METGSLERVGQLAQALRAQREPNPKRIAAPDAPRRAADANDGVRLSISESAKAVTRPSEPISNPEAAAPPESGSVGIDDTSTRSQPTVSARVRLAFSAYLGAAESGTRANDDAAPPDRSVESDRRGRLFRARA